MSTYNFIVSSRLLYSSLVFLAIIFIGSALHTNLNLVSLHVFARYAYRYRTFLNIFPLTFRRLDVHILKLGGTKILISQLNLEVIKIVGKNGKISEE